MYCVKSSSLYTADAMRFSVHIEYNDYAACRPNFGALTHRLEPAGIKFSLGLMVLISEEL